MILVHGYQWEGKSLWLSEVLNLKEVSSCIF